MKNAGRTSKKQVLENIDYEISRLEAKNNWTGRNQWVILGSLAAVLWLLLSEINETRVQAVRIDLINLIYLLLVFSVSYDWLDTFIAMISPVAESDVPFRLFTTKAYASPTREGLFILGLRSLGLILIVNFLKNIISAPLFLYFFYGLIWAVSFILLYSSIFEMPIRPTTKERNPLLFILLGAGAIGWGNLIVKLMNGIIQPNMTEIKLSLLLECV